MPDPSWEQGPWLIEARRRFVVRDCSSETAVRAVRATLDGTPMPHDETMPDLTQADTRILIHPEGDVPFPNDFLESTP